MTLDLKTLVAKLDRPARSALERAAQACLRQTHFDVEIEHLLLELIDIEGGDLACVLPHFSLERDALIAEIRAALEQFKRGNTRTPSFSAKLVMLLQDALVQSTIVMQEPLVRSGTLLLALLENDAICTQLSGSVPSILRVSRAALRTNFKAWLAASSEGGTAAAQLLTAGRAAAAPPAHRRCSTSSRSDLTADARAGTHRSDRRPRCRRSARLIDILLRRRQNNPILVGEAGVGKTAVVEGFALRIAAGDVPPPLATSRSACSTSACCRPAPASRASSRTG